MASKQTNLYWNKAKSSLNELKKEWTVNNFQLSPVWNTSPLQEHSEAYWFATISTFATIFNKCSTKSWKKLFFTHSSVLELHLSIYTLSKVATRFTLATHKSYGFWNKTKLKTLPTGNLKINPNGISWCVRSVIIANAF